MSWKLDDSPEASERYYVERITRIGVSDRGIRDTRSSTQWLVVMHAHSGVSTDSIHRRPSLFDRTPRRRAPTES